MVWRSALALQDTLANLFAGIHILASKTVQRGDYIKLSSGEEGYVEDINWRQTTVRALSNNLVVIPNGQLAKTNMTNYMRPEQQLTVLVQVGVAYDSDLEQVERVTSEVIAEVMTGVDGALPEHEPAIRFHTFGDSRIGFTVILGVGEFSDQYRIKHEFIKRLHRRYREEGIRIPAPARTVALQSGAVVIPQQRTGEGVVQGEMSALHD
ncbi:small-conductance mechanosensitive channel [Streptomyces achromogenes]|uniref:Small-conductance mechanosensitive channel n=1 Tax=Streptomyces achromogenes TaxID=67255 RepID=A0ABU0QAV1_STRAH|nr:small-conductance mechanosensitive channel [Streptomyces achromogenes]